jgi:cation diffusion facilitator CzcD-associated flavoprotein CzcO
MVHPSGFKNAKENAGKRVLVVGAGTSGHDIAWEHVNCGAGEHPPGTPISNADAELLDYS